MTKLKIGILGVLLVTVIAAVLVIRGDLRARIREEDEALLRQADHIARLESENERFSNLVAYASNTGPARGSPSRELLRLRGEVGVLRQHSNELSELRKQNIALSQAVAQAETNQLPVEDQLLVRQSHAVDAITALLQAVKSYATNHNGQFPADLDQLIASGELGTNSLAGNLRFNDFEFGQAAGVDPQGNPAILRLRLPIARPEGGATMVVGRLGDAGVPQTSVWTVTPSK